jgi:2'-deoxynucleoside 5'-phosphate N-hydrolase
MRRGGRQGAAHETSGGERFSRGEGMNIYFSCSLTGGRRDESVYGRIVDALLADGHEVPTAHLARPEVMELERVVEPREVFRRDLEWIEACDALVAEVSTPSHGVGYEIAYALALGKPVLCCYYHGARVSKMITGNDGTRLRLADYADGGAAVAIVEQFLEDVRRKRV